MERIREKVKHLRKKIKNRNKLEYLSGILVIAGVLFLYPEAQSVLTRIFFLWIILSIAWIFAYIYFKGSNDPLPKDDSDESLLKYQEHQIQREIEIGSRVHLWYIFPLFAGGTGVWFSFGEKGLIGYSIFALLFVLIWWVNIRAVKGLRKDLQNLHKEMNRKHISS